MEQGKEPGRAWTFDSRAPQPDSVFDGLVNGRSVRVGIPENLQTMQPSLRVKALAREVASLESRVSAFSAEHAAARAAGLARFVHLRPLGAFPRVVLTFDDDAAEARVDERLLYSLGMAVRAANRIYLHGHTDAFVASERGTALAIARVVEVRRLLVALHVESERIRLFYRGAGSFVANNSTEEGKALNRRVEIEFRKW